MKSHHPAAMVDRATCLNVLGENLRNDAPYGDDSFVEAESKSMYLLDIPVYYTSPANSALPGAGDDIPLLSGRDAVRRRLDELSDGGDAERHYDTIAKSLAAYGSSVRSDAHDTVERSALLVGNADAEMAKYAVEQITESIRQSRSARNPSSWLNATRGETNRWFLATSDHGLYNGSAGIFLGMANAHLFTQSDSARALAEELFADLVNVSNATQLRDVGVGAYGGISGIAYALAAGTQLGYDRDERAAEAIHRLSEICRDKLEKPEESDVISGAAGCLLVNAELLRVGLVDRLLGVDVCNAAVAALLHLAESGPEVESLTWPDSWSKTWLGGLSHGVAGVEWAATRYGRLQLGEPSLVAALRRGARLSQDSLLSDDPYLWADRRPPEVIGNPPMQAWCHGSEGIILGRLDSGSIDLLTDDELSTMASRLVGLPITTNPCICHGMAGRLIALDEMDRALRSRAIVRPDIVGLVGALEGALLDIAMKQRTLNDSSIELWNEGLMIGRSGMLWILSRISLPASQLEPSLLRLSSGP
jgi:lantibiotic modifying enzyme